MSAKHGIPRAKTSDGGMMVLLLGKPHCSYASLLEFEVPLSRSLDIREGTRRLHSSRYTRGVRRLRYDCSKLFPWTTSILRSCEKACVYLSLFKVGYRGGISNLH